MKIFLLTHQRELDRKTNTGNLALEILPKHVKRITWERSLPDATLLACIEKGTVALLFPSDASETVVHAASFDAFIILDGTWQEAQKIYNKSPYLHDLPKLSIRSNSPSQYHLRRNQKTEGLCTAEVVIALLQRCDEIEKADKVEQSFITFMHQGKET